MKDTRDSPNACANRTEEDFRRHSDIRRREHDYQQYLRMLKEHAARRGRLKDIPWRPRKR